MRVEWSPLASKRVDEIADYIVQDSLKAAVAWIERIYDVVDKQLGEFPLSGKPGHDVGTEGAREFIFESYRVFYDVGECVQILTVRRHSELIDEGEFRWDA
jgi:plasmid stabilization system protein ParE